MAYDGFFIPFLIAAAIGGGAGTFIGYSIVEENRKTREEYTGNDELALAQLNKLIRTWNEWVDSKGTLPIEIDVPPAIMYTPTESPLRNHLLINYWIMDAALRSKDKAFAALASKRTEDFDKIPTGTPLSPQWAVNQFSDAIKKFKLLSKDLSDPESVRRPYTALNFLANPNAQKEQEEFNTLNRITAWDHFVVPTVKEASRPLQIGAALITGKRPPFLTLEQWRLIQVGIYGTLGYMVFSSVSAWIPKPRRANSRKRYRVT